MSRSRRQTVSPRAAFRWCVFGALRFAVQLAVPTAVSTALLLVPDQLSAQASAPPRDLLARVQALGTLSSTDRITVYFESGHEAKALRLRALVQDALRFYTDSLHVTPELSLAVLEKTAWEKVITTQPYGIPGVDGTPPVAFLPATDDNVAANDALGIEGGISDSARRLVGAAGLSWPEASRRYVDLVGLHELGHVLASDYGIEVKSKWFNEWVATYAAYAFLRTARPSQAHVWEGILQGYIDAVQPTHRSIDTFERLYFGVGSLNYVWYQARFQQQVVAVYEAHGVGFLRTLRATFPRGGAPVTTSAALLTRLDTIAPGFAAWGAGMK